MFRRRRNVAGDILIHLELAGAVFVHVSTHPATQSLRAASWVILVIVRIAEVSQVAGFHRTGQGRYEGYGTDAVEARGEVADSVVQFFVGHSAVFGCGVTGDDSVGANGCYGGKCLLQATYELTFLYFTKK